MRGATEGEASFNSEIQFQPTRPLRGATANKGNDDEHEEFQPTRPLRGATKDEDALGFPKTFQPTRPLRGATVGRDALVALCFEISTHAPLAGRDGVLTKVGSWIEKFQPTRPLRGATILILLWCSPVKIFQPTRPLRGATQRHAEERDSEAISTHAPLAGRDGITHEVTRHSHSYFNPRAPCGARLAARGRGCKGRENISTHAPLAGRDGLEFVGLVPSEKFQPTRPLRGATDKPKGANNG